MESNKDLALGHIHRGTTGREDTKRLWSKLKDGISAVSVNGAVKDEKGWRMYYNDFKYKTLKKIRLMKSEQKATGGGKRKKIELSTFEERLYTILGKDVGEPISGVRHNPLINDEDEVQEMVLEPDNNNVQETLDASAWLAALESGALSPLQTEQHVIEDEQATTSTPSIQRRPITSLTTQSQPSTSSAQAQETSTRRQPTLPSTQRRRRRQRQDENGPPSPNALSRAQDCFLRAEEASSNSRLVLADAINNLATAYRERTENLFGGGMERSRSRARFRLPSSDSD